jgi:hypothetical protein
VDDVPVVEMPLTADLMVGTSLAEYEPCNFGGVAWVCFDGEET